MIWCTDDNHQSEDVRLAATLQAGGFEVAIGWSR